MVSTPQVKIGLIGLGAIGAGTYVPILRSNEQVSVVGVCDVDMSQSFSKA